VLEAVECLEPASGIVYDDEVYEMCAEQIVVVIVIAFYCSVFAK
tara:strand:- start:412 stop:543 length:132 start_codon:yes stop_codon:yes gene_type:complete